MKMSYQKANYNFAEYNQVYNKLNEKAREIQSDLDALRKKEK